MPRCGFARLPCSATRKILKWNCLVFFRFNLEFRKIHSFVFRLLNAIVIPTVDHTISNVFLINSTVNRIILTIDISCFAEITAFSYTKIWLFYVYDIICKIRNYARTRYTVICECRICLFFTRVGAPLSLCFHKG